MSDKGSALCKFWQRKWVLKAVHSASSDRVSWWCCSQMKSAGVGDGGLFTESYCNICNAQLISESQRIAHYEVSLHMSHKNTGIPPTHIHYSDLSPFSYFFLHVCFPLSYSYWGILMCSRTVQPLWGGLPLYIFMGNYYVLILQSVYLFK